MSGTNVEYTEQRQKGVLLEYPTTTGFQWGHLKNDPYTCTVSGGNGIGYSKTYTPCQRGLMLKAVLQHVNS